MQIIRRISLAALAIAFTHLVFGGIVRISGSGMGCGDHWPKCHGEWFPALDRRDLIIELTHRHLAVALGLAVVTLVVAAWTKRGEPGVGGRGGVLRAGVGALLAVVAAAGFGAQTVYRGNPASATVVHWLTAMTAIALISVAAIRAGGLGGFTARTSGPVTPKTTRAALVAILLAFGAVAMGGVTAKFESAAVACPSYPLCGTNPAAAPGAAHIQLTHRVLGFLLFFHLLGVTIGVTRRRENTVVKRAALTAFGLTLAQIVIAGAMIGLGLPALPRVLHQAVGVSIWVSTFVFFYLARSASTSATRVVPVGGLAPEVAA
jgi:heme A synthase